MMPYQAPADALPDLPLRDAELLEHLPAERVRVDAVTNAAALVFTANFLLATGGIPSLISARRVPGVHEPYRAT